jgi:16S rRNA (cytosine967-C5)-methyltransferase
VAAGNAIALADGAGKFMNARDWALRELDMRTLPGWPPDLLRSTDTSPPTDPRDLALAEQIVLGTITNFFFIQHLLTDHSGLSIEKIDALLRKILAIGMYQLRFLDRVPPSAAVFQAVEQAKRFRGVRAGGFVNAVLRSATSRPDSEVPLREEEPREFAHWVLSHPPELFDRLTGILGIERALQFCEHNNRQAPTILRVMGNLDTREFIPHQQPGMFIVQGVKKEQLADWSRRGLAQVQDPTSAAVVYHLNLQPGQTILDRCAGLGTKTLQIRQWIGDTGKIIAVDPSNPRCQLLRQMLHERGITNIEVHTVGMLREIADKLPHSFNGILADVPCANSGVLARRPEARFFQDARSLASLRELQKRILGDTAPLLAPGGRMVYSTCSIWPEENELQIGKFLERHRDFKLLHHRVTWPSFHTTEAQKYNDGGYVAVLTRE